MPGPTSISLARPFPKNIGINIQRKQIVGVTTQHTGVGLVPCPRQNQDKNTKG